MNQKAILELLKNRDTDAADYLLIAAMRTVLERWVYPKTDREYEERGFKGIYNPSPGHEMTLQELRDKAAEEFLLPSLLPIEWDDNRNPKNLFYSCKDCLNCPFMDHLKRNCHQKNHFIQRFIDKFCGTDIRIGHYPGYEHNSLDSLLLMIQDNICDRRRDIENLLLGK